MKTPNMSNPLVSVLIPCYNVEEYVKKAVDSILNQTYKNLEIWLMDDASTDDTRAILKGIKDKRIKYHFVDVNTKKIGLVNEVLSKINGKYFTFQDADDWSELTRIEKQVRELENSDGVGIVFTKNSIRNGKDGKPIVINYNWNTENLEFFFKNYGKKKYPTSIACPTMMVEKSIIDQVGGYHPYFKGKAASDIYWVYNILKVTKPKFIDETLYHNVRTEDSFTEQLHSLKNVKSAYIWKVISKLIEYDKNGMDLLENSNELKLTKIELEACENAMLELNARKNGQITAVRESKSYKIGNKIIQWFKVFKN